MNIPNVLLQVGEVVMGWFNVLFPKCQVIRTLESRDWNLQLVNTSYAVD